MKIKYSIDCYTVSQFIIKIEKYLIGRISGSLLYDIFVSEAVFYNLNLIKPKKN